MSDSHAGEPWMPALLALAREIWVLRDRQRVLESLLAERGTIPPDAVSEHQPSPELQASLDRECRAFIDRLLAELRPPA